MSNLNILVNLKAFSDSTQSNSPLLNHFNWNRAVNCLSGTNPKSDQFTLEGNENSNYFNGLRTLSQDASTEYSLAKKPGANNTYRLSVYAGTDPGFATEIAQDSDNTTSLEVTKNGIFVTFSYNGTGSAPNYNIPSGTQVLVQGTEFSSANQGTFKVKWSTPTSFTVENPAGVPETVVLSDNTDTYFYLTNNVRPGDILYIPVPGACEHGYAVTKVMPGYLEFSSNNPLPEMNFFDDISISFAVKTFIYLETDRAVEIDIDGNKTTVSPPAVPSGFAPAIFMATTSAKQVSIRNLTNETATVFVASIEG